MTALLTWVLLVLAIPALIWIKHRHLDPVAANDNGEG